MVDGTEEPKDLIGFLDFYLVQKAPFQLPDGVREFLVRYGPWIIVVFMVLSVPGILFVLGIGTLAMPFGGVGYATGFGIPALGLILQIGLMAIALPGLFARKMSGWTMLFYAEVVGFVTELLIGAFGSAIIRGLIGLYILFQIRGLYK